jgi:D-3-phosphoglycerate dehydrogenase
MSNKVLLSPIMETPDYDSEDRRAALQQLGQIAQLEPYPLGQEMQTEQAEGVIGVIADSSPFHDSFYRDGKDLRLVTRWGVGFDQVNVKAATALGVVICVAPVHMDTVAEYAITQWLATLKRVYTLNHLSHGGDFSIIRTFDAQATTLGLYGFGRIGQQTALRANPLLGERGKLLVYDIRPDIKEVAAEFGAEAVDDPMQLFERCDTVSLHVAGDDPIVSYEHLCAMKPHASLINPSRGNLVDDEAVNRAIREEKLYYYVVDDPVNGPRAIHKDHPRIICTNHNGGITQESVVRLDLQTIEQVTDAINGREPAHILNREVLDHPRVRAWLK